MTAAPGNPGEPPANAIAIAPGVVLPEEVLQFTFSRSGGPGGQNVNKVNTQATLTVSFDDLAPHVPAWAMARLAAVGGHHVATDRIVISSSESRSQSANRQDCLDKLRDLLVRALHRPKRRKPTRPSRGAVQRRLTAKKQRSETKARRQRPE